MAGRRVDGEGEAQRCLAAVAASGLTLRNWAVAQGIDARSLNMWRVVLKRRPEKPVKLLRFVELVPTEARRKPARYLLHVGGVTIEVDDSFDEHRLQRLLQVVATCSG